MKVNLVGCGGVSKCHFNAINMLKNKGAELTAVADIVTDKADAKAQENSCKAYYDYVTMLNEEKPDVVHICTPHYLHVDMAVEALERDINVVLEKPCGTSVEGLKRLIEAEKASKGKLAVCFQNRYNSSVVFAKELIESKKFGEVKSARAIVTWRRDEDYYSSDAWRGTWEQECGGVLINQAIHTHDLMQYLCGKTTKTVEGHISNYHLKDYIEVEDTASVYFTYEDGTRAVYFATNASGDNSDPIVEIFCEKAVIRVEGSSVFKIADGVVTTPKLASAKDVKTQIVADKFQRIIQEMQEADIMFLIQQSNLRNSELKSQQMKDLHAAIKEADANEKKRKGLRINLNIDNGYCGGQFALLFILC